MIKSFKEYCKMAFDQSRGFFTAVHDKLGKLFGGSTEHKDFLLKCLKFVSKALIFIASRSFYRLRMMIHIVVFSYAVVLTHNADSAQKEQYPHAARVFSLALMLFALDYVISIPLGFLLPSAFLTQVLWHMPMHLLSVAVFFGLSETVVQSIDVAPKQNMVEYLQQWVTQANCNKVLQNLSVSGLEKNLEKNIKGLFPR